MRIRIVQKPTQASVDGLDLTHFAEGCQYEVGSMLGAFLLAEGLAEPVDDSEPALIIPMRELPRRRLEDRVPLAADMARGVRAPAARRDVHELRQDPAVRKPVPPR